MSPTLLSIPPATTVGESPVWDDRLGLLWWVDIGKPALLRSNLETGATESWEMPAKIGSLALCRSGAVLVALATGIHRFDPATAALTLVAAPEPDRPMNRLNDGKASPEGRFLVGSMNDQPVKEPTGALHRLDPDGTVTQLVGGLIVANGLAWSPDGRTLWFSDSRGPTIWTAPYDPATGAVGERHVVASPDNATGRPDGAAMDAEGGYWSAGVSASCLNRWTADGRLDRVVRMPVKAPTMPCFFGPGLSRMVVTSLVPAEAGADDGKLVVLDVGVAGAPVGRFAD